MYTDKNATVMWMSLCKNRLVISVLKFITQNPFYFAIQSLLIFNIYGIVIWIKTLNSETCWK